MKKAEINIREYTENDLESILGLFHDTVHTINIKDYTEEQISVWAPPLCSMDRKAWNGTFQNSYTIVAECGEIIVGFANITEDGYLDRFYVHKDYQRQSVGKLMFSFILSFCRTSKISRITTHSSITAVPFFEQMGFIIRSPNTVERNGITLKNYIMVREEF